MLKSAFMLGPCDFDIEIDWSNWSEPVSYGGGVVFDLRSIYNEGTEYLQIARNENFTGQYIEAAGSQGSTQQATGISQTSGKFRIARVGTTMTAYYDIGGGWVSLKSDSGYGTGRMSTRLRAWQYNAMNALSMDFDNFRVTTGCANISAFSTTSTTSTFTSTTTTTHCIWDDHFNRKNDQTPDPDRWNVQGGPDTTHIDHYNNQLRLRTATINDGNKWMLSTYTISGDFDIQVDFDLDTYPATNSWYFGLGAWKNGGEYVTLYRNYYNGQKYRVNPGQSDYAASENTGKLRLVRSGSTVQPYKWNGASWDTLGSGKTLSGDVQVYISVDCWNSDPSAIAFFNNLRINTCALVNAPTTTTTTTTISGTSSTTTEAPGTYSTNWSGYTADVAPDDWTEIWEAPVAALTVKDDGGQYGAQYLLIDHSTFGPYFAEWDDVGVAKDVDVLAKVQFNDGAPGAGDDYFKVVLRQVGGTSNKNGYELRLYPADDQIKIYKWVSNVASQRGATAAKTLSTYWYWVRFQVRDNNLKAKVWSGQPTDEPGGWDIETTDSDHAGVYGSVGLGSYEGDATWCDYFSVGVGGSDAPAPADYLTTTTTTTTTTSTTTTGTTESPMEPATYVAVGSLQAS
jgi:hypothetical protein